MASKASALDTRTRGRRRHSRSPGRTRLSASRRGAGREKEERLGASRVCAGRAIEVAVYEVLALIANLGLQGLTIRARSCGDAAYTRGGRKLARTLRSAGRVAVLLPDGGLGADGCGSRSGAAGGAASVCGMHGGSSAEWTRAIISTCLKLMVAAYKAGKAGQAAMVTAANRRKTGRERERE